MQRQMNPRCGESKNITLQLENFVLKNDDLVAVAVEWCSFADIARLRRASTRCLSSLCDWPFQQISEQLDGDAWESVSDKCNRYMNEKGSSLEIFLKKVCRVEQAVWQSVRRGGPHGCGLLIGLFSLQFCRALMCSGAGSAAGLKSQK